MFTWGGDDLNTEQEAAVLHPGSVFLVACPGSGKTKTLTYKIAYELSRLKSKRQYVVAVTYTHRAADEIRERIEALGVDTSRLWIGTIHSFCLKWILKPYGIYHETIKRGFRVIDQHEREKLLCGLCESYKNQNVKHWDCDFYFTANGCVLSCPDTRKHGAVIKILEEYISILESGGMVDFEMILYYSHQLMNDNPEVSVILSGLFSFIMIDEYQDTKKIQYSMIASILRLGKGRTKAFIVGDSNQAIYQTLGGYPMSCSEFESMSEVDFKEMRLSKNYRSSDRIVKYFSSFETYGCEIEAASRDKGYKSVVSFNHEVSKDGLEDELVRLINFSVKEQRIPPGEVCVIAPQWGHLASMMRRLVSRMPEYSFNGPGMVPFVRDVENFWYKLARIALTQSSPSMYLRRLRWAGEVVNELESVGVAIPGFSARSLLKECNRIRVDESEGLDYLERFFETLFSSLSVSIEMFESLKMHHAAFFEGSRNRIAQLEKVGGCISGIDAFRNVFRSRSGITFSTIHGVKGTEFDTVIAYALLEGMVPHFSDKNGLDSAKKLLYVVASRARKNLHLISERGRVRKFGGDYQATKALVACKFDYDDFTSESSPYVSRAGFAS